MNFHVQFINVAKSQSYVHASWFVASIMRGSSPKNLAGLMLLTQFRSDVFGELAKVAHLF